MSVMEFSNIDAFILAIGAMGLGILLLIQGGNWTIDSAVYIARKRGISPLVVGFTIVAFGTSLPELIISVFANLSGSGGIALGNVLGSNIANILGVIGVSALFGTIIATGSNLRRDLIMMLFCTVLLAAALQYGMIDRAMGGGMLALLLAYVVYQYIKAKKGGDVVLSDDDVPEYPNAWMPIILLLGGLVAIALGAEFLVRGAKVSASVLGVPEDVIALSIIAIGTSLPELSTCIIAARKGHSDIVLGNIVGSNVFNILMILGVTTLVKPIAAGTFDSRIADFDVWVTLAVSVVFAALIFVMGKINRTTGWVFLSAYLAYTVYIYAAYMMAG
jgi:cation:H+ antiporter